ncbi:MAG: bifunctional folylpolyglutamate synthase/dihydrofolate synthase [Epsilonproteobacteria bacterium]|nr:bifunctional folylpolyglutamate synthase/dihydrofolate synthase [Campylobacterota bacterium]
MRDFTKQKQVGEIELRWTEFLESKPLFYQKIDYDRMPNCWNKIKNSFKKPKKIIHIIGTNGKGSTGRFLATYLHNMGFSVGHYTSPHIQKFNERIWVNGKDIDDESLERAHQFLQNTIPKKYLQTLSYFEYTTLLAMRIFGDMDYVILEAGLGGEKDATSVFERDITLVTPIDYDHQAFLGDTIKDIATTKLNSIQNKAIIGKQIHDEVYDLTRKYPFYIDYFDNYEIAEIRKFIKEHNFASYLADNLALALACVVEEGLRLDLKYLKNIHLKARLQKIDKNTYIDVGHNPLAAKAILNEFAPQKINLIYNTYKDKDYKQILTILKPIINKLFLIDINDPRILQKEQLLKTAQELGIDVSSYDKSDSIDSPTLVFGSFSVVEEFLNEK